jgi:hypothetical protein
LPINRNIIPITAPLFFDCIAYCDKLSETNILKKLMGLKGYFNGKRDG